MTQVTVNSCIYMYIHVVCIFILRRRVYCEAHAGTEGILWIICYSQVRSPGPRLSHSHIILSTSTLSSDAVLVTLDGYGVWYGVKNGSLGCHLTTYITRDGSGYLKQLGPSGVTCMMS